MQKDELVHLPRACYPAAFHLPRACCPAAFHCPRPATLPPSTAPEYHQLVLCAALSMSSPLSASPFSHLFFSPQLKIASPLQAVPERHPGDIVKCPPPAPLLLPSTLTRVRGALQLLVPFLASPIRCFIYSTGRQQMFIEHLLCANPQVLRTPWGAKAEPTLKECLVQWRKKETRSTETRASLVAQRLRILLPMQGTRVQALVREDPACCGATKSMRHNY